MKGAKRLVITLLGPALFLLCYFLIPTAVFGSREANGAIGALAWMALWWITGAVDYAVTGFLPIVINALFSITDMAGIISKYASDNIILILGASIITVSWEATGLDKRISAFFLSFIGNKVRNQVVFWFILCTIMSAILPNAVVTAAMIPIAYSMLTYVGEGDIAKSRNGSLILLTIAYAAGVGGLASPLGGAMNLKIIETLESVIGEEYMYASWVVRFLPIMVILMVSNILMLLIGVKKGEKLEGSRDFFKQQYKAMPKITGVEIASLAIFIIPTVLSFARPLFEDYLPGLKPAYLFMLCGVLTFFITKKDGTRVVRWKEAQTKITWDMIYIFAGGLALGQMISGSGADKAIGNLVASMNLSGGFFLVLIILTLTLLLSDVTSNTATAAVAMPIVVNIVSGIGENPIPYIYVATIGVNLSYMLPTSIRAIPVGYGLQPKYMLKKGVPITVVMILVLSLVSYAFIKFWPAFSTV